MTFVEWRDDFETGIPSADKEHRKLIELINELHGGLGEHPRPEKAVEVLEEIAARFSAHFRIEEDVMRGRQYDHFDSHRADHERLLGEVRKVIGGIEGGGAIPADLPARLDSWFAEHFRGPDTRLHKFLDMAEANP